MRVTSREARLAGDAAAVVFVAAVTVRNVWWPGGVLGTHIAGPRALTAWLPLALALPLLWRRRFPLAAWTVVLAAISAQALASGDSAEGLELVVPFALGGYAVAAFGTRRRALAGLGLFAVAYTAYALEDRNIAQGGQQAWSGAFWGLLVLVFWFAGVFVRARREADTLAAEAVRVERAAEAALYDERTRIARELHDLIAHTVSVIGIQAGAAERVLRQDPERAKIQLESIQDRARESVLELRRVLDILREGEEQAELSPQPRLDRLAPLLDEVRHAGLHVALRVEGNATPLPSGVELSAFRIIQEALTNVLKHAGATRAEVLLRYADRSLGIEVADDGAGPNGHARAGHGLIGMRERTALYGGTLTTGRSPTGGFLIAAELPLEGRSA
jgi:signal transduction histidine kinase